MLDSIYQLGLVTKDDPPSSSLLTPINAKHVLGMIFRSKDGKIEYQKVEPSEFQKTRALWYLYKRDYSGQGSGLLLTGNISKQNIEKLQKAIKKDANYMDNPAAKNL